MLFIAKNGKIQKIRGNEVSLRYESSNATYSEEEWFCLLDKIGVWVIARSIVSAPAQIASSVIADPSLTCANAIWAAMDDKQRQRYTRRKPKLFEMEWLNE